MPCALRWSFRTRGDLCAFWSQGIQPLLDAVVSYLPSPVDARPTRGILVKSKDAVDITPDGFKSLCALAFKVQRQPDKGPVVFFRVYSGNFTNKMTLLNTTTGEKERSNKLFQMQANEMQEVDFVPAGHIGAAVGLKTTKTGAGSTC
jgi:elongation factor G